VAGPIERAQHLLPQVSSKRTFNYKQWVEGSRLILWGLFKKVVIADSLAQIANPIFADYANMSPMMLLVGSLAFTFQIYGDFSGYSDIALGSAKLLGFELLSNFKFPYFSRSIAEFWRRWHISLSSWFRDYLYIPLGGSQGGMWMKVRNTFI
jgi:D-alanyl-lipoteichoic acid acyltransferase DltB (MBOAT superfamily)